VSAVHDSIPSNRAAAGRRRFSRMIEARSENLFLPELIGNRHAARM
jgi:hypothetical protein